MNTIDRNFSKKFLRQHAGALKIAISGRRTVPRRSAGRSLLDEGISRGGRHWYEKRRSSVSCGAWLMRIKVCIDSMLCLCVQSDTKSPWRVDAACGRERAGDAEH